MRLKPNVVVGQDWLTAALMGLNGLLAVCCLCGCGQDPPATDEQAAARLAREKIAEIAAGGGPSDLATAEPTAENSQRHPIDQLAEGAQFRTAVQALDNGDIETAMQIRDELAASQQYHVLATAIDGMLLVTQGKYEQAIAVAEEISAVPVMQAEAYVLAGEVFQRQNRLNEAIGALSSALEINPQHLRANLLIGAVYYDTGAMRLASQHLRRAAELDPSNASALLLSGKIHKEYEQYQEALADYNQALTRITKPELELHTRVEMALCQTELRQLDEARATLADCPTAPAVVAAQALISEAAGNFDLAQSQAQEALDRSPQNRIATLVLGRIYVTQRNWDQAIQLLGGWVEKDAFDHEVRLLYGRALVGAGKTEVGQREIQAATDLKNTFLKFADLHQEAIKRPDDAALRVELGQLAEKLGKMKLARTWYLAAIGLDPANAPAQEALQKLEP